jgi:hypothetical protein
MMDSDEVTENEKLAPTELKAAQRLFEFWASDDYWRLSNKFHRKESTAKQMNIKSIQQLEQLKK